MCFESSKLDMTKYKVRILKFLKQIFYHHILQKMGKRNSFRMIIHF